MSLAPGHETPDCRVCHVSTEPLFSLGSLALSGFVRDRQAPVDDAPLALRWCPRCTLVQLSYSVDPAVLYREYWYQSGINETMVAELRDVVVEASMRVAVSDRSHVLDIGANDGTLLRQYAAVDLHPWRAAVEPAPVFDEALAAGAADVHYQGTFPTYEADPARDPSRAFEQSYRLITAIAQFYNVGDPLAYVKQVREILAADGLWVLQFQDLLGMIESRAYDNICHEHLEYYTLHSLMQTLAHEQLRVLDVVPRQINGGSLRVYVGHRRFQPEWASPEHVLDQLAREEAAGLLDHTDPSPCFRRFAQDIRDQKTQLQALLAAARHAGPVAAYGASTKGNTLLQVCNLGREDLAYMVERSEAKFGKYTARTGIPIRNETHWRTLQPATTLVPIWQFRDHVLRREAAYLEAGGTFIFPLPRVEVVTR